MQETERKFLVDRLPPDLDQHRSSRIVQGYLAIEESIEVRLRRLDDERLLTAKKGTGETREEVEVPLDADPFDELWKLTESRRVAKRRFLVPLEDGHRAEVDVYADDLEGLVVTEVEFSSEEESQRFQAPWWFGRELTGDHRYANQELALHGRPPESPRPSDA
jgi:CYTH domain-containing protein